VDRLERLLTLTMVLLGTPRPLAAAELAERVPGYSQITTKSAFRRAIERDKDTLREMGVPITVEPVPGTDPPIDGYRIHAAEYALPDPGLDREELAALALASSAVRMEGAVGSEGLWKLGGAPRAIGDTLEVAELPGGDVVLDLFRAIEDRATASFRHRGRDRTVEPARLNFREGHWYLTALDLEAGQRRSFRLDRIDGEVQLGPAGSASEMVSAVGGPVTEPWLAGPAPGVEATVLVDAELAPWAVQQVGESAVLERRADGAVVVQLEVRNPDGFRSFVVGFLHHAEILDPPALRKDLLRWLERVP
jgi:predicted DNA-binding transcriptional regulator YafY